MEEICQRDSEFHRCRGGEETLYKGWNSTNLMNHRNRIIYTLSFGRHPSTIVIRNIIVCDNSEISAVEVGKTQFIVPLGKDGLILHLNVESSFSINGIEMHADWVKIVV